MQPKNFIEPNGLIHIYEGDGKGKTTAAIGLSIRFAGNGGIVLFTQFLKNNNSGELKILDGIEKISLICCEKSFGFTFQMTLEEKKEATEYYTKHLHHVLMQVKTLSLNFSKNSEEINKPDILLVLDEILAAYHQDMVNRQELIDFLKEKPANVEVVLTGRKAAPELLHFADYITCMEKRRHPYEKGIKARKGIEW